MNSHSDVPDLKSVGFSDSMIVTVLKLNSVTSCIA